MRGDLDSTITRGSDDTATIICEYGIVYIWSVSSKFFQHLSRFQTMNSTTNNIKFNVKTQIHLYWGNNMNKLNCHSWSNFLHQLEIGRLIEDNWARMRLQRKTWLKWANLEKFNQQLSVNTHKAQFLSKLVAKPNKSHTHK